MVLHFARNIQNLAIFCKKTDNKLTTRIGGEGVAEQSPLDPIIDSCPDKIFHNCDFGRKFEKTQGLDDALRRWLVWAMRFTLLAFFTSFLTFGCSSKHSKNLDDIVRDEVLRQQRDLTDPL